MSSIKCYGLFWDHSLVELDQNWAYGWKPTYKHWRSEPDAPDMTMNQQAGVYVLQTSDRKIVYIGQSGRGESKLGDRLWSHTRNDNRGRWTHFSWFGLDEPFVSKKSTIGPAVSGEPQTSDNTAERDVKFALNELEAILITVVEPPLNKRGGDWLDAKQYLQWSQYEHTTNSDLWKRLSKKRLERIIKSALEKD